MTGCEEWRDAVAARALGDAEEPALTAHLAVCAACAEALRETQAVAARMDQVLYRRAAVEPPFYLPDRVMARVVGQNPRPTIRWRKWAAVSGVAALLIVIAIWMRRPPTRTDLATLTVWRSPTEALLRPPVGAAWNVKPRLGEGLFQVKVSGEIHAQ